MSRATILEYQKWNPSRSTRWRYDEALSLVNAQQRSGASSVNLRGYDRRTRTVVRFLTLLRYVERKELELGADLRIRQLFPKFPGLFIAYEIYSQTAKSSPRNEIEARILSGQSDQEIAKRMSTRPDAISWYEATFFNVRDRLEDEGYIGRQVIGDITDGTMQDQDRGKILKYWGYYAGADMLNAMLSLYDESLPKFRSGSSMVSYLDDYFVRAARLRSVASIGGLELDKYKVMQMYELHANLIDKLRAENEAAGAKTPFEDVIGAVLDTVQWTVGARRKAALESGPLGQFTQGATELRADEMLRLSAGETVDEAQQRKNITLPPPRHENPTSSSSENHQ